MKILHGIVKCQTVKALKSGQRLMKQIGGFITYETHQYINIPQATFSIISSQRYNDIHIFRMSGFNLFTSRIYSSISEVNELTLRKHKM